MGYIPYCYLGAAIVVIYKLVALVFTSLYQIKIEKRKEYLDEILAWQKIEEATSKQGDMQEQELTPFIEKLCVARSSRPSVREKDNNQNKPFSAEEVHLFKVGSIN